MVTGKSGGEFDKVTNVQISVLVTSDMFCPFAGETNRCYYVQVLKFKTVFVLQLDFFQYRRS